MQVLWGVVDSFMSSKYLKQNKKTQLQMTLVQAKTESDNKIEFNDIYVSFFAPNGPGDDDDDGDDGWLDKWWITTQFS